MSSQLELERLKNTYYYCLTSDDAQPPNDEIGLFDYVIPPFPLMEHNSASRCIFTLTGCVIGDQIANQQIGQTSYFSLDIQGLGLSGNNYNSTNAPAGMPGVLRQSNRYFIPNQMEEFSSVSTGPVGAPNAGEIFNNVPVQRLSGTFDLNNPYNLICSNPVGKPISFRIFNDVGAQIGANAQMNTIIRFHIEVVPDS